MYFFFFTQITRFNLGTKYIRTILELYWLKYILLKYIAYSKTKLKKRLSLYLTKWHKSGKDYPEILIKQIYSFIYEQNKNRYNI